MPVFLRTSRDLSGLPAAAHWLATTDTPSAGLDPARKLPGLAARLEAAFMAERDTWWRVAGKLAGAPGADLSHTVACGAFGSDFGLMLAWCRLAGELAAAADPAIVLCDDPWLFRALSSLPGVSAGAAPPLAAAEWKLRLRGLAVRAVVGLRLARAVLATRHQRAVLTRGDRALLVYGHPASRTDGFDTYFGDLMREMPALKRLLHTDCPPPRAAELAADGRTASLHAWGCPLFAFTMPLWAWRPRDAAALGGPHSWLVRRAAARENGGGGPAMNRWQMHCQRRMLKAAAPSVLCWPWENHGWERDLCRSARAMGVRTVGYQHTVIGPHQINYSTQANADGVASLPDIVAADGPAYAAELRDWGVPAERLVVAGAWRLPRLTSRPFDPAGPVFVPLSAIPAIARLQVEAARRMAASGRRVLVKEHPMYPLAFADEGNLTRTDMGMAGHAALSAVVYSTGTSGLEALLLGIPALRLQAEDRIAIDVLPAGIRAPTITLDDVPAALATIRPTPPLPYEEVLAAVDMRVWKSLFNGAMHP